MGTSGVFDGILGLLAAAARRPVTMSLLGLTRLLAEGLVPGKMEIERLAQLRELELVTGNRTLLEDAPPAVQLKVGGMGILDEEDVARFKYKKKKAQRNEPSAAGIALSGWGTQGGA